MEEHLASAIQTCVPLQAIILDAVGSPRPPEEWFFESSSLGLGDNVPVPDRPYMVWNELTDFVHQAVSETSHARTRTFQLYVYDHKGDFTRINQIHSILRDLVKPMAPFTTTDGIRCSQSLWAAISGHIVDDGYDSCCKFATVQFTVSR